MASGTVAETAICWEEGATGAVAVAVGRRQAAPAGAAAPPCYRGHQYNESEISISARGKVQSKSEYISFSRIYNNNNTGGFSLPHLRYRKPPGTLVCRTIRVNKNSSRGAATAT